MRALNKVFLIIGGLSIVAGIALLTIGLGKYYNYYKSIDNNETFEDKYENVKSLEIDVAYGNVTIKEGDSFYIEAYNIEKESFSSTLENGVWKVQDNTGFHKELSGDFEIFDVDIPITWILWDDDKTSNIVITIPSGFTAENIDINIESGYITADYLVAKDADINVDAGYFHINDLTIQNKSYLTVGAGEMIIDMLNAKDISIENSVGYLKASGNILGDSYVKSDFGGIKLCINGEKTDYNYDIDCNVGSVKIDGYRYTDTTIHSDAKNNFFLECDVGSITLDYTSDLKTASE